MSEKRLFISFDYEHDDELRHHFLAQAKQYSKHKIVDHSFPGEVDGKRTREAMSRIGETDIVIFICGDNTHTAPGVEAEMTITQQLRKRYILLKGRPNRECSRPKGANSSKKILPWSWKTINSQLDK